ncbi:MAG TPA: response regulator [Stellaceae bacterium]|nr:response regulator [Stellaceae bacterium]
MTEKSLAGLRILIIEDESLISMLIEDTVAEIGCEVVGIAARLDDAMRKLSSLSFDVVILDVNLHGCETYPIAETLAARSVPFIFATGYGAAGLPEAFREIAVLQKPFRRIDLQRALVAALTSSA